MKFAGKNYSLNKLVSNIISVYHKSSVHEQYDWYKEANLFANELSNKGGISIVQSCGIIASLSPLKRWDENKRIAEAFIVKGDIYGLHTSLFINKAIAIHNLVNPDIESIEVILKGPKIISFFHNILNPDCTNNVTIDRHAICIALNKKLKDTETKITKNQYTYLKLAYLEASKELDISPLLLQSSTWLLWRRGGQLELF